MVLSTYCAGIMVFNGMPWIPYLLRNIYPMMDQIVITEGAAYLMREFATPQGRSTDGTIEAIRAFPDPERKITLIQKDGFWEEYEMVYTFGEACRCDYLWHIDCDEFYKQQDMAQIKAVLAARPEINAVSIFRINFFGGMRGVINGGRFSYGGDQLDRIFRWRKGYRYVTHRAPTIVDEHGVQTNATNVLRGEELAQKYGIYIYHYSYVLPTQVKEKAIYYERVDDGYRRYSETYDKHFVRFTPYRVFKDKRPLSWLEPFRGEHPPEIQELIADSQAGRIPYDVSTRPEINRLLDSWWRWRFWKLIGMIDAPLWWFYDRPFRDFVRPVVRFFRARFFGYDYSQEKAEPFPRWFTGRPKE